jgi:hypothetical protein
LSIEIDLMRRGKILSELRDCLHFLRNRLVSPIAQVSLCLLLMALEAANRPAWIGGNPLLHSGLLFLSYACASRINLE